MNISTTVFFINCVILLFVAVLCIIDPVVLGYLLMEDTPVEWTGFLCLIVSGYFWLKAVKYNADRRIIAGCICCAGLALLSLFVAGEEVSWGQRIFSYATPEFFRYHNVQKELTIHNLGFVWLHPKGFAVLFMITYGVMLPVVVALIKPIRRFATTHAIPIPPWGSSFGFLIAAWLMTKPITGTDDEIGELVFSFSLLGCSIAAQKLKSSGVFVSRLVVLLILLACIISLMSFQNTDQRLHLIRIGPLKSGQIFEGLGRNFEAAQEYEKLARFWKTDWNLWIRVMELYRDSGEIERAYDLASWFLRIHRREWRAYEMFVECGLLLDRPDDADSQLRELLVEEPENHHIQRARNILNESVSAHINNTI